MRLARKISNGCEPNSNRAATPVHQTCAAAIPIVFSARMLVTAPSRASPCYLSNRVLDHSPSRPATKRTECDSQLSRCQTKPPRGFWMTYRLRPQTPGLHRAKRTHRHLSDGIPNEANLGTALIQTNPTTDQAPNKLTAHRCDRVPNEAKLRPVFNQTNPMKQSVPSADQRKVAICPSPNEATARYQTNPNSARRSQSGAGYALPRLLASPANHPATAGRFPPSPITSRRNASPA